MADTLAKVREQAQYLRNAAPIEFDKFRAAFSEYYGEVAGKVVTATDNLKQVQGQVQQCYTLREMFEKLK